MKIQLIRLKFLNQQIKFVTLVSNKIEFDINLQKSEIQSIQKAFSCPKLNHM